MNTNRDLSGRPDLEGRLRRHLDASAAAVGTPALDLDGIRRRGRRRRTAVRSAVATTSVVALVAVGLVALRVTGGDGDEGFTVDGGTPVADSVADDATVATAPGGSDETDETSVTPTSTAPATAAPMLAIDVAGAARSVAVDVTGANIAPWRGGFVRLDTRWESPPIGPFTDEVIALFPPEVVEFFADGAPATAEEGLTMLADRPDLLAEIQRVMDAHPAAYEAIMGGRSTATIMVDVSADGVTWEPVGELVAPEGVDQFGYVGTSGDRLIVVGDAWDETGPSSSRPVVASTLDLRTWDTVQELEVTESDDLPTGVARHRWVSGFHAGTDRAAVVVTESVEIVVEDLVPDDVRNELMRATGGYSTSIDATGFTVEVFDSSDEVTAPGSDGTEIVEWSEPAVIATYTYRWDEVGVDPALALVPVTHSSIWSGDVVDGLVHSDISELGGDGWVSGVVSGTDGVAWAVTTTAGPKVFHATDGVSWTDRTPPIAATASLQHLGGTADGLVLFADVGGVPEVWVADGAAQAWELGDASLLAAGPDGGAGYVSLTSWGRSGHAAVMSYDPASRAAPVAFDPIVLERDGYRLVSTPTDDGGTVELVRIGVDGAPDESVFLLDDATFAGDEVFTPSTDGSITVSDPESGEPLVTFTADDVAAASAAVLGTEAAISSSGPWAPTFVLVFTEDGRTWRVLDRIEPEPLAENEVREPHTERWPSAVVVADGQVLLGLDGGEAIEYRLYDL